MAAQTSNSRLRKLETENQRLREENSALRKQLASKRTLPSKPRKFNLQSLAVIICIIFATALLIAGNLLLWAGNTVAKTDRYVEATAPLIRDPIVQEALATRITDRLFENVDIEQVAEEALPPRANFLVPTLAEQLENYTEKTVQTILARPEFQERWNQVNERAHQRLISLATELPKYSLAYAAASAASIA